MNETLLAQLVTAGQRHGLEVAYSDIPGQSPRKRLTWEYITDSTYRFECYCGPVTDEALGDFIAYLDNKEPCEETLMNIYSTDLFTYLAGDMIGQGQIALTITGFTQEDVNNGRGGKQVKQMLSFKERDKKMILNKTNAKVLAGELGPETNDWIGARITIAAPVVDAFGKSQRSLRIVKVESPAPQARANGNGATRHPPAPPSAAGSPGASSAIDASRESLAPNAAQPPADVRALIAWQQGEPEQSDLFSDGDPAAKQAALDTAAGRLG